MGTYLMVYLVRNRGISRLPIVTEGLSLYLNSYDSASYSGSGTTWSDTSGNGRNFNWTSTNWVTGTTNYFRTNSGRLARGPASNSFGIDNTSGYTIQLFMFQFSATSNSAFKWYSSNGAENTSAGRGIFAHSTWSDGNIYFDQGGCCNANTRTSVAGGAMDSWNVITFRRGPGGQRDIWKNNTLLISNAAAAANINLNATAADIGQTQEYTGWDAGVSTFVVYNRNLTDNELNRNVDIIRSLNNV
jgi:hypothetical protein